MPRFGDHQLRHEDNHDRVGLTVLSMTKGREGHGHLHG